MRLALGIRPGLRPTLRKTTGKTNTVSDMEKDRMWNVVANADRRSSMKDQNIYIYIITAKTKTKTKNTNTRHRTDNLVVDPAPHESALGLGVPEGLGGPAHPVVVEVAGGVGGVEVVRVGGEGVSGVVVAAEPVLVIERVSE